MGCRGNTTLKSAVWDKGDEFQQRQAINLCDRNTWWEREREREERVVFVARGSSIELITPSGICRTIFPKPSLLHITISSHIGT